jgi:hypothetical protein
LGSLADDSELMVNDHVLTIDGVEPTSHDDATNVLVGIILSTFLRATFRF